MKFWMRASLLAACILLVAITLFRTKEGFECRRGGSQAWTASRAGWKLRTALIHNEHEPEQNALAWSPEAMPAPFKKVVNEDVDSPL